MGTDTGTRRDVCFALSPALSDHVPHSLPQEKPCRTKDSLWDMLCDRALRGGSFRPWVPSNAKAGGSVGRGNWPPQPCSTMGAALPGPHLLSTMVPAWQDQELCSVCTVWPTAM